VLTTNQRGAIAEAELVSAALKLGIGVFSAVHDERYDLVFDLRPRLLRVQCKTALTAARTSSFAFVHPRTTRRSG
jgi:hypothetical protein